MKIVKDVLLLFQRRAAVAELNKAVDKCRAVGLKVVVEIAGKK